MRYVFTDRWNSFWHVVFGMIAVPFPLTIPIFLAYQFILYYDDNSIIDTLEYLCGGVSYVIINYILISSKRAISEN